MADAAPPEFPRYALQCHRARRARERQRHRASPCATPACLRVRPSWTRRAARRCGKPRPPKPPRPHRQPGRHQSPRRMKRPLHAAATAKEPRLWHQRNPRRLSDPGRADLIAPSFIPLIDLVAGNIIIPNQCTLAFTGTPLPLEVAVMLCARDGAGGAWGRGAPGGRSLQRDGRQADCAGGQYPTAGAGRGAGAACPRGLAHDWGKGGRRHEYCAIGGRMPAISARSIVTTALR